MAPDDPEADPIDLEQDALDGLADSLVESFAAEEPGAQLLTLPRDSGLTVAGVGRLVAALAQCGRFFANYADVDDALSRSRGTEIAELISTLGLIQADHTTGDDVFAPRALLVRISRILEGVAELTAGADANLGSVLREDAILAEAGSTRKHAVQTSTFDLTASSPHIIYDFIDSDETLEISSPQLQMTFITTFTTPPLGRELALINDSLGADYFHRYNHLQRRCWGPEADDAVYLIRWLTAFHETDDPETHPRGITASMLIGQVEAAGVLPVTARALPTGEYLLIVVEPEDTVEFLFRQISRDIPVTFYPTRRDDGIRPLTICWDGDLDSPTAWNGTFRHADMPADMTFAELASHLQSSDPPNEMGSEPTPAVPQTDMVRGIHRIFSASTLFRFKLPKPKSPRKPAARLGGFLFR